MNGFDPDHVAQMTLNLTGLSATGPFEAITIPSPNGGFLSERDVTTRLDEVRNNLLATLGRFEDLLPQPSQDSWLAIDERKAFLYDTLEFLAAAQPFLFRVLPKGDRWRQR